MEKNFRINKGIFFNLFLILIFLHTFVLFAINPLNFKKETTFAEKAIYSIPIIMYHSIVPNKNTSFTISPDRLEGDLKYIKEQGYTAITINELIKYTEGNYTLPDKPIIITFDDGYYNNYVYLPSLMKKYDMKCVISIVGSFSNSKSNIENKPQSINCSHLNAMQIIELAKTNRVEFQHHSYALHSYGKVRHGIRKNNGENSEDYKNMLVKDTEKLNDWLYKNCNIKTYAYTYPFGSWCKEAYDILKEMGFKATLGVEAGINKISIGSELKNLYRFNRFGNLTTEEFFENMKRYK